MIASVVRGSLGAVLGGAVAGAALRARQLSRARDASIADVVGELPGVLQQDAERLMEAARVAVAEGKRAAVQREEELEKVLRQPRQKGGT